MSGGALGLTGITGDVDLEEGKFAYVEFQRAGQPIRWDFPVDDDRMQSEVINHHAGLLRSAALDVRLYWSLVGQGAVLVILTKDQFACFAKLSRFKFNPC